MNFRKLSVPFDFEPEFPEILVEWNVPTETLRPEVSAEVNLLDFYVFHYI